jgi:hypothetical protein
MLWRHEREAGSLAALGMTNQKSKGKKQVIVQA